MIAALAWRNIWRQPIRTSLSVIGMAFTSMLLVFMLSLQLAAYDTMKSSMLRIADGFGQFQIEGYKDDPEMDKVIADPAALLADLERVPGVTVATARAAGFGLLASGERSFAVAILGIDPAREPDVSTLSGLVEQGRSLTPEDNDAIVLGDGLARNLRLGLGDRVALLGSGRDGSVAVDVLEVVGIFKSKVPELDRAFAQMPLVRFAETFLMEGGVHAVAVAGEDLPDVVRAERELREVAARHGVVYLNWAELRPDVEEAIAADMITAVLIYVTLVVVVVFITLNTLYMSVLERTREFGVLLAIGMKRRWIGRMVWMEMIFLSLFGNGLGILLGMVLTYWVQQVGIGIEGLSEIYESWGMPARFYPAMTPFRVLFGPFAIVLSIAVLGIVPYRRVLGLDPVKAMAS
ncbi:MAG: ABC transporter permease [Boseongicola sp. SB0673_bin_14]|nr:ABC transporter permease [Boseongicola sp.]MYI70863.1 ABC transporter permease [Boseongicola sp. SB0673_bin_14]